MSEIRFTKQLTKNIELNFQNSGYKTSEDFINAIKNNDKIAMDNLVDVVLSTLNSSNTIKSVLKKSNTRRK